MAERTPPAAIETRLRALEGRTGVQVVVAVLERADLYHGLRWRAFSFAAAFAGALAALWGLARPASPAGPAVFAAVAAVLGAGLLTALAATLSRPIARLFLEPLRAEAEVRQRAQALFLERELFATRARTAVLLLACRFERRAVALPDAPLRARASRQEWAAVEDAATRLLGAGRETEALLAALEALEHLLVAKGFSQAPGATNELPDTPLMEPGTC